MRDNHPEDFRDYELTNLLARLEEMQIRCLSMEYWQKGSAYDDALLDAIAFVSECVKEDGAE